MLAIQGVHVQEQFVREHPQHWGVGKLRSEAIEGWIGLCKQYQRKHGNYNKGWVKRLHKFIDLYTVGAVMENLIDFSAIERKHYLYQKLIYEDHVTDTQQTQLENQLPNTVKNILQLIDSIEFNKQIPNELQQLLIPNPKSIQRMQILMQNVNAEQSFYFEYSDDDLESGGSDNENANAFMVFSENDNSESDTESETEIANILLRKRKSKAQHFQDIHSQRTN